MFKQALMNCSRTVCSVILTVLVDNREKHFTYMAGCTVVIWAQFGASTEVERWSLRLVFHKQKNIFINIDSRYLKQFQDSCYIHIYIYNYICRLYRLYIKQYRYVHSHHKYAIGTLLVISYNVCLGVWHSLLPVKLQTICVYMRAHCVRLYAHTLCLFIYKHAHCCVYVRAHCVCLYARTLLCLYISTHIVVFMCAHIVFVYMHAHCVCLYARTLLCLRARTLCLFICTHIVFVYMHAHCVCLRACTLLCLRARTLCLFICTHIVFVYI